jgi:hypothetical protein
MVINDPAVCRVVLSLLQITLTVVHRWVDWKPWFPAQLSAANAEPKRHLGCTLPTEYS